MVAGIAYLGWVLFEPDPSPANNQRPEANPEPQVQQRQREPDRREIALTAEHLSGEVSTRSPTSGEAREHAQLALSLRNQEMQTRRAALIAEMRRNEYEAMNYQRQFQALRDMDRDRFALTLSGEETSMVETSRQILQREAPVRTSGPSAPPVGATESTSLSAYRLLGIFQIADGDFAARLAKAGGAPERVLTGYIIDGDIEVSVLNDRVVLRRDEEERSLYL